LKDLLIEPDWSAFAHEWFDEWLFSTSTTTDALSDPTRVEAAVNSLFTAEPNRDALADAEIVLAVAPDWIAAPWLHRLKFVLAIDRAQQDELEELLATAPDKAYFLTWAYHQVVNYGWRTFYRLQNVSGGLCPGVLLRPDRGDLQKARVLLEAVTQEVWILRQLFEWLAHVPPVGMELTSRYDATVGEAMRYYEQYRREYLRIALGKLTPAQMAGICSDMLADKVRLHYAAIPTDDGIWIGYGVESNNVNTELFYPAYGAVIDCIKSSGDREPQLVHALLHGLKAR
jgi:hypothetical protein